MTSTQSPRIDEIVAAHMHEGSIPSVALAVVQGARLLEAKSYGIANLEHQVPATNHTVFKIASLTKTFTATAAMPRVNIEQSSGSDAEAEVSGTLEVLPEGWGFLRRGRFPAATQEIYVSRRQVERFGLQSGNTVEGLARAPKQGEQYWGLLRVTAVIPSTEVPAAPNANDSREETDSERASVERK